MWVRERELNGGLVLVQTTKDTLDLYIKIILLGFCQQLISATNLVIWTAGFYENISFKNAAH